MMIKLTKLASLQPTLVDKSKFYLNTPGAQTASKAKIAVGVTALLLALGVVGLVVTRKGGYSPNRRHYKTKPSKREYMKGYRAGRKFCG